jgi:hypothetical protein
MASEGGAGTHPDAGLVELFRGMRADARGDPKPAELSRNFAIDIGFDGAGALPTIGQCQLLPLGNIKARITGAVIVANGIGSAAIDLRHGTIADVAAGTTLAAIYGGTGSNIPTLTSAAAVELDISTWTLNLQPQDVLIATLTSILGAMTSITISVYCRHLKWAAGSSGLTDTGGDRLTTSSGSSVTLRS